MRKIVIGLGVALALVVLLVANAQSQVTALPIQATMAATVSVLPTLPSTNAIPASNAPVLGGAANEAWTPTYIAQQTFQRGYLFWVSTTKTIWVLTKANAQDNNGVWTAYPDTFTNGEPESDPALVPPGPGLYQPVRGFGKVWRKQSGVSEALGWGTTPEFELITPIGYLTANASTPGRYLFMTLGRELISLTEAKAGEAGGTWQLVGVMIPGGQFIAPSQPTQVAPQAATQSATFGAIAIPTQAATAAH